MITIELIIRADKEKSWLKDGWMHRTDGPAYILPDRVEYLEEGKRHRKNGPAIIFHPPNSIEEFWEDGRFYAFKDNLGTTYQIQTKKV